MLALCGVEPGPSCPIWSGPFGVITAAILLRAGQSHPDRIGDPLAPTVNYAGPIADGKFDIASTAVKLSPSGDGSTPGSASTIRLPRQRLPHGRHAISAARVLRCHWTARLWPPGARVPQH